MPVITTFTVLPIGAVLARRSAERHRLGEGPGHDGLGVRGRRDGRNPCEGGGGARVPGGDLEVKGDDYRVFLTEIGDCGGLYVSRKGPHRFEVKSRGGAAAKGSFDYRVVARRFDDVGKRMEKVEIPPLQPLDVERVTRPVAPPSKPER